MAEIVPADPIIIDDRFGIRYYEHGETSSSSAAAAAEEEFYQPLAITDGNSSNEYVPGPFDSERLPSVFASEIQRFLRVANIIGREEPRVAYLFYSEKSSDWLLGYMGVLETPTTYITTADELIWHYALPVGKENCISSEQTKEIGFGRFPFQDVGRFHAFEISHNLDKGSSGRGVRQFKTALLQRLEQDEEVTIRKRKEKSDTRELKRVYHAYRDYFMRHDKAFDLEQSHREKLINARNIASVLFEVLKTVSNAAGPRAFTDGNAIPKKSEFNILPLDQGGIQHAIMQQNEIKAAIAVMRNVRGLPPAQDFKKNGGFVDLFDFLQHCFGFQEGNVANQREHLILLLANMHTRQTHNQTSVLKLAEGTVDELMKKFFKNYTNWCKFLGRKNNILYE
ncbi:hypothetical protein PIB30_000095 [Stylosanthes scabra]|uniref:Uncharacterized protein n=1 Tax=Stylosanthes scabra TaxID=79078 RepID=A0ABU6R167_9FABA|nr:hypothetical protein [Stylosanthes scabra]